MAESEITGSTGGDTLVFEVNGVRFGLDTAMVASIVESEKISFIPGQSAFVKGVISLRGEPVAVIDSARLFPGGGEGEAGGGGGGGKGGRGRGKVIVASDGARALGFFIGSSKPSFFWEEETSEFQVTECPDRYVKTRIEAGRYPIHIVDWPALFDEAARVLATE